MSSQAQSPASNSTRTSQTSQSNTINQQIKKPEIDEIASKVERADSVDADGEEDDELSELPLPLPIPPSLPTPKTSRASSSKSKITTTPVQKSKAKEGKGKATQEGGASAEEGTPEEWSRKRKDDHKEVERKRRETINDGINGLKKIVPGCEKNKGSILSKAAEYIISLQLNESSNIEKWTLQQILSEKTMSEAITENQRVVAENKELRAIVQQYQDRFGVLTMDGTRMVVDSNAEAASSKRPRVE